MRKSRFFTYRTSNMEYSPDDIAAAANLQLLSYIYTSMTTFWIYDYACSLHEEWKFLLRSRWSQVKALYVITRYLPFVLITMYLCLNFTPNANPNKCRSLINIYSSFCQISIICSGSFFVLRTYALWNNNRTVLAGMLSAVFAITVASVSIRFITISTSYVTTSAIPGIPGCYWSSSGVQFFMPFILLFVFQLVLISLTLTRVIQSWRSVKGHLHAILVTHNISYYACGLLLSAVNVLIPVLFSDSACYSVLEDFQVLILAILSTRMHLHLWHIDRDVHGSDALVCISMSNMSPADHMA
ncbi:hypothetical protein DEU56DRAFT_248718 [Suillus clintonianus]|uniref:uncharacterized protein n=1 Tax=Suillus clintonianus TaxID=1904413 RepID=UPI001B85D0B2|nr:uncharacterized protein DEU56DRAFT_248718 [Suillus clintonianus]KAG2143736.1 hypothetical protein DEU56DRAFT_248718 [Suillus clintonianus]